MVVASSGSKSSDIEDLGFVKFLWRVVVASNGSKSSKDEGVGFVKPLWQIVVASGGSKSATVAGLGLLSLYGGSLLPLAGRNPQKMKVLDVQVSNADRHCLNP